VRLLITITLFFLSVQSKSQNKIDSIVLYKYYKAPPIKGIGKILERFKEIEDTLHITLSLQKAEKISSLLEKIKPDNNPIIAKLPGGMRYFIIFKNGVLHYCIYRIGYLYVFTEKSKKLYTLDSLDIKVVNEVTRYR
jgi:hypothetical protein